MRQVLISILALLAAAALLPAAGCTRDGGREVIVYCALDQVFSSAILADFEAATGIAVRAVYDTEATKSAGLAERLRRERANPRCDVYWNNEVVRTILLAREDTFEPYASPAAADIPARFRDAGALWTGFAARARVVAFDPARVLPADAPRSHAALIDVRWRGALAIGNPEFGTTGGHLALLLAAWGDERFGEFLRGLAANDVRVVAGNAASRDRVLSGAAALALTDTDDVAVVRRQGKSIDARLFEEDGAVIMPNTLALVRGAPHPAEARALIDYLLSKEVEARLAASPSAQIPVRADVPVPAGGWRLSELSLLDVSYEAAADRFADALRIVRETLRR